MDIKKIINLFKNAEGYIGLNAAYANKIAGFLEEYARRTENLVDYNADLNNQLNKAEVHIEMLEKQKEAMLKELCDKEALVREAEGRFYELEKELDALKNATKKQPEAEWISVEDRLPEGGLVLCTDGEYCFVDKIPDMEDVREDGVTHWMHLPKPPKPKEPTFKDKFLEMFPKAELNNFRVPVVCAGALFSYLKDNCNTSDCSYNGIEYQEKCYVCWNQPYFEEEGEADA